MLCRLAGKATACRSSARTNNNRNGQWGRQRRSYSTAGGNQEQQQQRTSSSSSSDSQSQQKKTGGFGAGKLILWTGIAGGLVYAAAQTVVHFGRDVGLEEEHVQRTKDAVDTVHHYARTAKVHAEALWSMVNPSSGGSNIQMAAEEQTQTRVVPVDVPSTPTTNEQGQQHEEEQQQLDEAQIAGGDANAAAVVVIASSHDSSATNTAAAEPQQPQIVEEASSAPSTAVVAEPAAVEESPSSTATSSSSSVASDTPTADVSTSNTTTAAEPLVVTPTSDDTTAAAPATTATDTAAPTAETVADTIAAAAPAAAAPSVTDAISQEQLQRLQADYALLKSQLESLTNSIDQQSTMEVARIQKLVAQYELKFAEAMQESAQAFAKQRNQDHVQFKEYIQQQREEFEKAIKFVENNLAEVQDARKELVKSATKQVEELERTVKSHQVKLMKQGKYVNIARSLIMLQQRVQDFPTLPFDEQLTALSTAVQGIKPLENAIRSIPAEVASRGLLSFEQLRAEFDPVAKKGRRAALTVEGAQGVLDHIWAVVRELATPESQKSELLPGNDNWARIARARYFLNRGLLEPALNELDQLDGVPKTIVQGFVEKAHENLVVQQKLHFVAVTASNLLSQVAPPPPQQKK